MVNRSRSPFVLICCALIVAGLSLAGIGCGGGDDSSSSSGYSASATASDSAGPSHEEVLACLKEAGINAADQSSNISGETIGVDYSGGRTVISFEGTEADAKAAEQAAETYGEVTREGLIVASFDMSPEAIADQDSIESCIAS